MAKKIYRKNPGQDDDWIIEGELDERDLEELGRKNKTAGLEFRSVAKFPTRPFRHLASMRLLKFLQFHSCPITPADMADLASLTKLESLWFEDCPVTDAGVKHLAKHPKLFRVVLSNTKVTDAALKHLATIPRLQWLWLDGTAVTDRGLAHLATATGLKSLALRDTAVTNEGILEFAVLPKLNLSAGVVRGTAVTEAGLDALFAAQKMARKAARVAKKAAPKTSPAKQAAKKTPVTLDPAEIDAAKAVLYAFFKAMNEWEVSYVRRQKAAGKQSKGGMVTEEVWEACREDCRQIFSQYCTPKKRAYGRPENVSAGSPPDYEADPRQEPVTSIETPTRRRIVIETRQEFNVKYRCQYVLLKKGDRWLIDNKKIWGAGWEWTIL